MIVTIARDVEAFPFPPQHLSFREGKSRNAGKAGKLNFCAILQLQGELKDQTNVLRDFSQGVFACELR